MREMSTGSSPFRMAIGNKMMTPVKLDHQASAIAELSTVGNEDFIHTAWSAMNRLERTP